MAEGKKDKPKQEQPKPQPVEMKEDNVKYLVRVANTDFDGAKQILFGLRKIKGINSMFANAVCAVAGVDKTAKAGTLKDADLQKLNEVIENPVKHGIPEWLLNRRKDYETGENMHNIMGNLQYATENDIKRMKKIKCYKGMRHAVGLPVRGQKMRSKHRKSKSRGKGGVGVKRKPGAKSGK